MRAAGLVCLGAGAGLIRGDLRDVRGTDVGCRSGGVVVTVRGARPRAVPVLARYHARLLAAAAFAGTGLICGGTDPGRRNLTNPLIRALDGGGGLPRLDTSRLRATWLADCAELLGLATFMHAAGISCSQRLGDLVAGLEPAGEADAVRLLGARPAHDPAGGAGGGHRRLRRRAADRGHAPRRGARPAADASAPCWPACAWPWPIDRPAHLTRVHQALTSLPEDDQRRLGVIADWKHGPHLLTYRQTECTFGLVAGPSARTSRTGCRRRRCRRPATTCSRPPSRASSRTPARSLAVDWTDLESFSRPPPRGTSDCADPEASWGHRKNNLLRTIDELFFGYYLSAAIMMRDENGPARPRTRPPRRPCRSCRHDPVRAFAPVLTAMPAAGIPLGDILADSGYSHRDAGAWAIPLRAAGRAARPGPAPARPRPQGHPPGRHHQPTATCTAPDPPPLLELGPLVAGHSG